MTHQTALPRARGGRTTLVLGSVTAGLIAVGQAPASAAPADITNVCAAAPATSGFTDAGGIFAKEIACLEATGITTGVAPNLYAPNRPVTRAEMASFVVRLVDTAIALQAEELNGLPEASADGAFTDVSSQNAHHEAVNQLAEAGIIQGGPGGRPGDQYGPDLPVTRAQIATMLAGAYAWLTGEEIAPPGEAFTDIGGLDPQLQDDITALAEAGVTAGRTADTYAPFDPVSRGQMAAFLARLLSVLEANEFIQPLPGEDAVFTTELSELNGSGTTGTATVQIRGREATD
jgi:hypothetical protein